MHLRCWLLDALLLLFKLYVFRVKNFVLITNALYQNLSRQSKALRTDAKGIINSEAINKYLDNDIKY